MKMFSFPIPAIQCDSGHGHHQQDDIAARSAAAANYHHPAQQDPRESYR